MTDPTDLPDPTPEASEAAPTPEQVIAAFAAGVRDNVLSVLDGYVMAEDVSDPQVYARRLRDTIEILGSALGRVAMVAVDAGVPQQLVGSLVSGSLRLGELMHLRESGRLTDAQFQNLLGGPAAAPEAPGGGNRIIVP